jgi:hypothetical protein
MRIKNFCLELDPQKNDCGSAALQGPNLYFGEKKLEVPEKLGKKKIWARYGINLVSRRKKG